MFSYIAREFASLVLGTRYISPTRALEFVDCILINIDSNEPGTFMDISSRLLKLYFVFIYIATPPLHAFGLFCYTKL